MNSGDDRVAADDSSACAAPHRTKWWFAASRGCILVLPHQKRDLERDADPMNFAAKIRARRAETRTRRAVAKAIDAAATPAMRHELMILAQSRLQGLR